MPVCGLRAAASAMLWSCRDPLGQRPHLSNYLSVDSPAVYPGCSAGSRPRSAGGGRPANLRQGAQGGGRSVHEGRGFRRSRRSPWHTATGLVATVRKHGKRPPLVNPIAGASRCDRTSPAGRASCGDHPARRRACRPNNALHPTAATRPFGQAGNGSFWARRVSARR